MSSWYFVLRPIHTSMARTLSYVVGWSAVSLVARSATRIGVDVVGVAYRARMDGGALRESGALRRVLSVTCGRRLTTV